MRPSTRHEQQLRAIAQAFARRYQGWSAEDARERTGLPLEYIRFTLRRLMYQGKVPCPEIYSPTSADPSKRGRSCGIVLIDSDPGLSLRFQRLLFLV